MNLPCSACGAKLEFKPGAGAMACPYCGAMNALDLAPSHVEEIPLGDGLAARHEVTTTDTAELVSCKACAASFTLDDNTQSGRCPFCGVPIVLERRAGPLLRPNALLPFLVESRAARIAYETWLKGLWFAPNDVSRAAKTDGGFRGLYLPFWTFDAHTDSRYTGERGINRTVRDSNGNSRTVTDWFPCAGAVALPFDDVLVPATTGIPTPLLDALDPWPLDRLTAYDPRPLAGFVTEQAQLQLEQGFARARDIMDSAIRRAICADIGGDSQRIHSVQTQHHDVSYKAILLPVWVNAFRYNGKSYRIAINGTTGKVSGDRPYSWIKIALAVLAAAAIGFTLLMAHAENSSSGNVQIEWNDGR